MLTAYNTADNIHSAFATMSSAMRARAAIPLRFRVRPHLAAARPLPLPLPLPLHQHQHHQPLPAPTAEASSAGRRCYTQLHACQPPQLQRRLLQLRPPSASLSHLPSALQLSASRQLLCARHTLSRASLSTLAADVARQHDAAATKAALMYSSDYLDPTADNRQIGNWLLIVAGTIFVMVSLGGLTRLTRSGLSMTEWKLTDVKLPSSTAEWEAEFDKYKAYPEYKLANNGMSLEEFKQIYYYEYFHRLLGRGIGLLFAGPLLYFIARRKVSKPLAVQLSAIFALGGMQGAIGWWMVKSGLEDWGYQKEHGVNQTPRVSPYRLCTHLISAFFIYSLVLRLGLKLRFPVAPQVATTTAPIVRRSTQAVTALTFATVLSGAFVAGNQAGLIYNEFPRMGNGYFPDDMWLQTLQPQWRNFFENSALVQFDHRVLALSTATAVLALWTLGRTRRATPTAMGVTRSAPQASQLAIPATSSRRRWLDALLGVTAAQVSLGITTLIYHVPVSLGALHQAGSLTLLSTALITLHTMTAHSQITFAAKASGATNARLPSARTSRNNIRAFHTSTMTAAQTAKQMTSAPSSSKQAPTGSLLHTIASIALVLVGMLSATYAYMWYTSPSSEEMAHKQRDAVWQRLENERARSVAKHLEGSRATHLHSDHVRQGDHVRQVQQQ